MSALENRIRRGIFAACRSLGLDDEDRHAIQMSTVGKASLKDMSTDEMMKILRVLNGRQPRSTKGRSAEPGRNSPARRNPLPAGPHTSKLRALWISGWWLGVVEDRSDDALASWIRRQTGMDAARWATPVQTSACIEALKGWLERDGGVDWSPYRIGGKSQHAPGARIMEAIWRRLHQIGAVKLGSGDALHSWVIGYRRAQDGYTTLPAKVQNQLIRELGGWLKREEANNRGDTT